MKQWKGYQKGINFGGWFSQCDYSKDRFENFIKKEDVKNVASWGLDHVRVPVDYNLVENENGGYKEEGFTYIQRVIDWCGEYGINMILDLHKTAGYSFDSGEKEEGFFTSEKYQERFYRLWEEFAKRFGKYSDRLAFELLNEVTEQSFGPIWNRIADICISRVRKLAPEVYILVGGYWNNSVSAVKDLAMPQDDHIIYNFHCYDPIIFTHQGAYWCAGMPLDFRMKFDESYEFYREQTDKVFGDTFGRFPTPTDASKKLGPDFFRNQFAEAIRVANERNVALYCGEYGVIDRADPQDALKWYKAIHEVFAENGIGHAAWSYREMDFGFVDEHFAPVLEEVKKYL